MEKAHGWVYVRSKNNGKVTRSAASNGTPSNGTPQTPALSTPGSYIFDAPIPEYGESFRAFGTPLHVGDEAMLPSLPGSDVPDPFPGESFVNFGDTFGPFDPNFSWEDANVFEGPNRPVWLENELMGMQPEGTSFESSFLPPHDEEASLLGENFDWANVDQDMTTMNLQLATPAVSVKTRSSDAFSCNTSVSVDPLIQPLPSLSPGAHPYIMLYSPHSLYSTSTSADEGYADLSEDLHKPADDFRLFDDSCGASPDMSDSMFQDLSEFPIGSAWSGDTGFARPFGVDD